MLSHLFVDKFLAAIKFHRHVDDQRLWKLISQSIDVWLDGFEELWHSPLAELPLVAHVASLEHVLVSEVAPSVAKALGFHEAHLGPQISRRLVNRGAAQYQ